MRGLRAAHPAGLRMRRTVMLGPEGGAAVADTEPVKTLFDQFALGAENRHAYASVAEPKHPHSVRLMQFWEAGEKAGGLVVGRDIPSRPIAGILRNLMICEPVGAFSDFRIRHAGTAYIAHYGCDVTGKLMSDLFDPDIFKHNCQCAAAVIRSGRPEVLDADLSQFGISRRRYEVVQLPVWGPDRTSRWLLCGIFRFD